MRAREQGITLRGRKLCVSTLRQILRKRIYTGAFDFDGGTYQGSQEPLITTDLWDRVQRILDERKEHQTKVFVESFLSQDSSVAAAVGCA